MFQDIVLLVLVRNVDVFTEEGAKELISLVGMFDDTLLAKEYREALLSTLDHGDALVVVSTLVSMSAVCHDVVVCIDEKVIHEQN